MRNAFFAAVKWHHWQSFFMQSTQTQVIDIGRYIDIILVQPYWWGYSSKCHPDSIHQNSTRYPNCCISSKDQESQRLLCLLEGGLTFHLSLIDCLLFDLKRDDAMPFECFTACETLILMLMPSTRISSHTHSWPLFPVCPLLQACHGCHRSQRQLGEWS